MNNSTLRFGSVCSGIEAASVAWEPLGWKAAWLSEIEPFPSAVLAHHYPDVPNLGDMTALPDRIRSGEIEAPDIFCGGTPCQAFSVAGLRKSLDDARGNLSLIFCEIADAIDHVRDAAGQQPAVIFWENVPGVLSTKDNAFGCFLGALAGEDSELQPPGGKWSNAGCVLGPERAVAWRVLDAQYFGVAQRRRRVFVVASARDGFDPTEILFEFDGVRRDSPPSREPGQGFAADVAPSLVSSGRGVERIGETRGQDHPVVAVTCMAHGQDNAEIASERRATLTCNHEAPIAFLTTVPLLEVGKRTGVSTTDKRAGIGIGDAGDPMFTLQAGAQRGVVSFNARQDPYSLAELTGPLDTDGSTQAVAVALRGREGGATAELGDEVQNCLRASSGGGDKPHVLAPLPFDTTQITSAANYSNPKPGDPCHPLAAGAHPPAITQSMAVRRLTPRECERLQGFPDDYTNIPWTEYQRIQKRATKVGASYEAELRKRGKELRGQPVAECPDSPRYKALGNSWAVPNVRWIGQRIDTALRGTE